VASEPVRIQFKRGGKGAGVTTIERLNLHPFEKEEMLARFKKALGIGGTLKDGVLELQGDCRDKVEAELKALGLKVRRIG